MKRYLNKKFMYIICTVLLILCTVYFALCKIASTKANEIFAQEMSRQTVLRGSITAESITADIWGEVDFKNLVWLDEKGETVLHIKDGSFTVSMWDIITRSTSINTLRKININGALVSLNFNKDMKMDILNRPLKKARRAEDDKNKLPNLDLAGKIPQMKIMLNDCTLAVVHDKKYFVLHDVDVDFDSRSGKKIQLELSSGKFGGTIVGSKLQMNGVIDISRQDPGLNMNLSMYNIVPESLGLGNLKNTADVFAQVKGTLNNIIADGAVRFKELDLPALHFNDVTGNLHYEKGNIDFTDVRGGVYGGSVEGSGNYNIDNRHYSVDIKGHDLLAAVAAKSTKINCRVELDLKMRSDGDPKTVHTYGSFTSGSGDYMLLPFENISGRFSNQNKVLEFEDVVIRTKIGDITTDGFKIVDGRLQIEDIFLKAPDGSEVIKVR